MKKGLSFSFGRHPKWFPKNAKDVTIAFYVVMAVSADGKIRQEIAPENAMAMYPSISADGSKISYTTPAGGLYIMNITK